MFNKFIGVPRSVSDWVVEGMGVEVVYLDFQKAFDLIRYQIGDC